MINKKAKNIFLCIALISFLLCVFMGEVYRPWIYKHDIYDFGIAGSAVSFIGTITAVFFCTIYMKMNSIIKIYF